MSILANSANQGSTVDVGDIRNSLRFRSNVSAYLSKTLSTPTSQNVYTLSMWVKRGSLSSVQVLFGYGGTSGFYFLAGDTIGVGTPAGSIASTAVFRDPTAHYHCVYVQNGTTATLYVNNVSVATGSITNTQFNTAAAHQIGRYVASNYLDGYLSRVCFVDGTALTPSSFGYLNTEINEWVSKSQSACKAVVDAGGTNSFMLDFNDGSSLAALGNDFSAKNNDWTCTNISITAGTTYDWMLDTPTNNYATLNPLCKQFLSSTTFYGALLEIQGVLGVSNAFARTTFGASSGKFYAEIMLDVVSSTQSAIGIVPLNDTAGAGGLRSVATNVSYFADGNKRVMGTNSAYGSSWVASNIIGIAVDADAESVEFFKNNVSQGVITSTAFFAQGGFLFALSSDDAGSPRGYFNTGQRPFTYTPPTGFKALCQANLPDPAILNPKKHFDVKLRTGTGAVASVTGIPFAPEFIWIKGRTAGNHTLYDVVRGVQKSVYTSLAVAEETATDSLTAFTSDGYSMGANTLGTYPHMNTSGQNYVNWLWKAGGTGVTNTAGSITSTVSANTTAGFSIVTYTGTVTNPVTIGHGLNAVPKLIIVKPRNGAGSWPVYHSNLTSAIKALFLNTTDSQATDYPAVWNSTAPTSSVFTHGSYIANGTTYVAYCFSEIAGYSKFGSYTGNGSADGPFVYCGFRPKYLMVKRSDSASSWMLVDAARDTYNMVTRGLYANTADAEGSGDDFDFTANGFKLRDSGVGNNASGGTYIFVAFADVPAKFSNSR